MIQNDIDIVKMLLMKNLSIERAILINCDTGSFVDGEIQSLLMESENYIANLYGLSFSIQYMLGRASVTRSDLLNLLLKASFTLTGFNATNSPQVYH